jgi:hypothetical protein
MSGCSKYSLTGSMISIKKASSKFLHSDDPRLKNVERIKAIWAVKRSVKLRGPGLWGE